MQHYTFMTPLLSLLLLNCLLASIQAYDDDDDADGNKCHNLEHLKYELFGTKTVYEDARRYLRKVDDNDLPKPFDEDSLEKEHKELLKDRCVPLVFYFIGRHSARFPDSEDIELYNKHLNELINKMNSSSLVSRRCQRKRGDFFRWRSKMQARHDNLITHLGAIEERDIARRFKQLYPEFFDTAKARIEIGVTNKVRTAQTASAFLEEVKGLNLAQCQAKPTDDVDEPNYNLDKVLEAACYKHLTEKFDKPFLEFHKQCDKIAGGEKKIKDPKIERVKNPALKKRIVDRVANKLGLDNSGPNPPVTAEVLDSIFNMCKFENAMRNYSIWCDLFSRNDIEALEYIEDVNSYIKSAYGPQARAQQSCPLVKDLLETFDAGTRMTFNEPKRSYFYFSHADPIKKLLATFELFKDDESFSERRISDFERDLRTPKRRDWRSSVITPFSANLAFVLYRCPGSSNKSPKFKVLAAVTEQPVKLGGCGNTDCSSERFFKAYAKLRDCDLNKICARR